MKLIIEIEEKDYNLVCDLISGVEPKFCRDRVYKAIQNGTPLPKGHGRLIDADIDADKEIKYARKWIEHPNQYISQRNKDLIYYLEKAETVIEADESEEEE